MRRATDKLVSLVPPAVKIWGVFYVEEEPDHLLILPVLGLAIVERPQECAPLHREIIPLVFDRSFGVDPDWLEDDSSLGYLLEEELGRALEIFTDEIAERRKVV